MVCFQVKLLQYGLELQILIEGYNYIMLILHFWSYTTLEYYTTC